MIRQATHKDIEAIVALAVESVSQNPIPVKIDKQAMRESAIEALGQRHFLWVSERDGEVVGVVGAMTGPGFWFERLQCSVMLYYGEDVLKLIRRLMKWVKSRSVIKMCIFEAEPETDPRVIRYLKTLGLARESINLTYVRGA